MLELAADLALRQEIMTALASRTAESGGFLTRSELSSFSVGGQTRRLIDSSKGIWNPRDLNGTLSIVSSPDGPYDDRDVEGGLFRYDYRAGTVQGDNTKLRRAMELQLPLILLRKFETGAYIPIFPVYVVDDDETRRQFLVAVDEALRFIGARSELSAVERRYAESITRHRLHQAMFRGMVLHAYEVKCAVCRLRHGDLLDAAHITADSAETGLAVVTNGLSLCKIHHAAYDRNLMGISPNYQVKINQGLLEEIDGPMLKHGLQEMHGTHLMVPSDIRERPDRDRLKARFDVFLAS